MSPIEPEAWKHGTLYGDRREGEGDNGERRVRDWSKNLSE